MSRKQNMTTASLALLLFFGAGALAADEKVALGNVRPLSSSSIPSDCLRVYNTAIPGCSASDFDSSKTCSGDCLRGLDMAQTNLKRACANVNTTPNTLLGQALLGNLVEVLCSNNFQKPTTTSSSAAQTTTSQRLSPPSSSSTVDDDDDSSSTEDDLQLSTINTRNNGNAPSPTVGLPPAVGTSNSAVPTGESSSSASTSGEGGRRGGSPFDIQADQPSGAETRKPAAGFGLVSILGSLAFLLVH